jgi:hypothetical protein
MISETCSNGAESEAEKKRKSTDDWSYHSQFRIFEYISIG